MDIPAQSIPIEITFDLSNETDVTKWTDYLKKEGFNQTSLVINLPLVKIRGEFNGNFQNLSDLITVIFHLKDNK